MSLDKFQIPPSLAAELYNNSLVVLDGKQPIKESLKEKKLSVLGGNDKNILIAVNEPDVLHLPDAELEFLTGILNACKLSFSDIAVFNLAGKATLVYEEIISELKSKKIILFGIDSGIFNLPVEISQFMIVKHRQQTLLSVPTLADISKDKELKKQLWVCLKTMFDL